ncbi:Z-DNA-binding protein 1 isoform X2 [Ranitomeya variabilis]|uniref:Z-DNA-binding protein 1 isoform X2 n=1 Tax=Ranitomeya variabilis TaxID=490064 RepID=UPI00405656ED
MAENNETLITAKTRLSKIDCVLTDHQKEIYHCLEINGSQTALSIAKAVKKKTTSEVNPHLYKMKAMNLLEQNSKVWSIKAVAITDVEGPATNGSMSGTEVASKTIELTDQQKSIITFLTSNEPSKARNIAKGIGKKVAKDVNGDLYKMEKLNLLCLDNKEKLWSINTGLPHTLRGSPNCSLEDSAVNQSHIEIDGGKFSDEPDSRRDSGIGLPHTLRGSPNCSLEDSAINQSHIEIDGGKFSDEPDSRRDSGIGSQMTSTPQYVIRNYSINISGCHLFTIGDTTCATQGETTTIYHDYHDTDIAAQEPNQESAFSHGEQSTDNSLSEPILLHTSEDEGPARAPCTSSLGHSSYHEPNLNIATICDGLGNVTIDDQDNNGDLKQLACSGEKSTFL